MFYHLTPRPGSEINRPEPPPKWPHPLPAAKLNTIVPTAQAYVFRASYTRAAIVLAQGESYPAHFEHYVKKAQTAGSDPRRTYTALADWEAADHKAPAKDTADLLLAHAERGLVRVLADEFHHHVSAAKRDAFHRMQAELAHEAAVRQTVHVAIDAKGTGEPISDAQIRGMIAAARTLRNPTITGTVKSGTRGRTLASVSGAAAPGASVRARGVNVTDASRPPLPWTAWWAADASTGVYTVVGLTVGAIANDVGDRIRIEVEQWPGGAGVSTTALTHVAI